MGRRAGEGATPVPGCMKDPKSLLYKLLKLCEGFGQTDWGASFHDGL
jgi:hypothetical protein